MKPFDRPTPIRALADDADPIDTLLQQFISGAASQAGSQGAGYFLSLLNTGPDQQILATLQQLEAQVTQLLNDLRNDTNKIISTVNWDTLVDSIRTSVANIDANWTDLTDGLNNPSQLTAYVAVGTDLTQISEAITPGGVDPTNPGLLTDLVAMLLPNAQTAQAGTPIPRFDLDSLQRAYEGVQRYFKYLLGEQIRAIAIVINAVIAQGKDPSTWVGTFGGFVTAQCGAFLSAVETLVVGYCGDLTVLGLLTGPRFATNPIVAADAYAAACQLPAYYVFVRIWNGSGNGTFPFATGASALNQTAPALTLIGASGTIEAYAPVTATTTFPANNGSQWTVFRYGFRLTLPSSGTNTWQLSSFPGSFFNATVVSSSGGYHPFSSNPPQYTLNADGSGPVVSTALTTTPVF